jgi:NAD(P)-dependent dehydrogenase (short-subunit alcohol dehydrogenase family)
LDRWWRDRIYNLNGKTVLITGGSRGLGLVMARQLIEAGARLAICAHDPQELERSLAPVTQSEESGFEYREGTDEAARSLPSREIHAEDCEITIFLQVHL